MAPLAVIKSSSADGYWKKAYDSLDDDLRASINCAKTGKNDILAAVLKTANQKRAICIHKQWKVKLPTGEAVIIRDVLEKIAKWVNAFIAVGDVAVQYDPATAALPWAAVRFILQAAISDAQIEGAMVADLETVSRLIARYKEFEQIHLQRESTMKRQMEESLTRLYADVLRFLAIAVRHFDANTFSRGVKNVFKTSDTSLMEGIIHQETELLKVASLSDTETIHYLGYSVTRLVDQATRVQKTLDEAKHLELLRWLSSCPYKRHQEALSETRMPNSANWLLNHQEYRSWKNSSSSSILLLHGIPGSGKSRICSTVVDSFLGECAINPLAAPVAYFYCADCEFEPERAQPDDVMRSILRQLTMTTNTSTSQPMVRDIVLVEFERRLAQSKVDGMEMPKLTVKDCTKLILEVTTTDPVTLVVDALDQVNEHDRPALINALEDIVVASSSVVKVFLTSRNDAQVFSLLRNEKPGTQPVAKQKDKVYVKNIEISRYDTLQDMNSYVRLEVAQAVRDRRLLKRDPSPELSNLLVEKLVAGAGEMFQWVNIQVEYLCQHNREEDIVAALQNGKLATLDDTYLLVLERILSRIDSSRDIAIRTFSWLLYMKEPMSPDAFLAAVFAQSTVADTTKNREELVTICSNLVLLDSTCNTFRFSHHSVQEFLRTRDLFSPDSAQKLLATNCLSICMDGPSVDNIGPDSSSLDALYQYAALYWAYHCSRVLFPDIGDILSDDQDNISKDIVSFVYDGPGDVSISFMGWLDHIATISKALANDHPMKTIGEAIPNPEGSPLFVATAFGLDCLLREIVLGGDTIDWDLRNDQGHTSLYLACAFGRLSAARSLLSYGADPDSKCGKFGNSLQAACFAGHTSVVQLLLQHGVSERAEGTFSNALEACFRGHREAAAMVLLKHETSIQNAAEFDSALGGAAQAGFLEVLEYLEKLPLASQYGYGQPDKVKLKTARAIQGGQAGTLAVFLKNKSNPASMLPNGPIAIAAVYGHESIVELLASMKIDREGECKFGTPLRCAAMMGHERIVAKLIELGANVNGCGPYGTALQAASMKGHIRIVRLLLRSGSDVNLEGGAYGTALQAAAYHGHYDVVETLLDVGAKVHIVGSTGVSRDAFHGAAEGGHYDIVQLMLDRGFKFYNPPPPQMAKRRRPSPYKPLLRNHSPSRKYSESDRKRWNGEVISVMDCEPNEMSYADVYSVMGEINHAKNDKYLTKSRDFKSVRLHDHWKYDRQNYALEVSAATGRLQIITMLLERKSVLGISDGEVIDSLVAAAKHGQSEAFYLIFVALPSPRPMDIFLEALKAAAVNGHTDIVNFGIGQTHIDELTNRHLQVLMSLACHSTYAVAERVLSIVAKNASATEIDKILGLGLVDAARVGNVQVVELLLSEEREFKEETTRKAFKAACLGGQISVVSALLQSADKELYKRLVDIGLDVSATRGHVELVVNLVDQLLSIDESVVLTQPLIAAAGHGHLDVVKVLLRRRETWENYTADVTQALTVASFNGHEETVKGLIMAGADVNAIVPDMTNRYRSRKSVPSISLLKLRLSRRMARDSDDELSEKKGGGSSEPMINSLQAALAGLDPSQHQRHATTPLSKRKSLSNCEKVVKMLLDHGGDSNNLGGCRTYPIMVAAEYCSEQVVSWLIEARADVNVTVDGKNAVLTAAGRELGAAGVLRLLLEAGAHVESDASSVDKLLGVSLGYFEEDGRFLETETLKDAMIQGPGAVAQILFKALPLAKAEHRGFQGLLQSAVVLDDRACFDLLLHRGVEVNSVGSYYGTALQAAARFGRLELARCLLETGANPNVLEGRHQTPLRAAVVGGHATVVKLLLHYGANINMSFTHDPDSHGRDLTVPLLNLAVHLGNADIVSMLVDAGIDVVSKSPAHIHPLILACNGGNTEVVRCLLEAGAPAGVPGKVCRSYHHIPAREASALHMACHHGHKDIIHLLLSRNVEIDMEIKNSGTPLQVAANSGHAGIVRLLLKAGADVDHVSDQKETALSMAASQGHLDTVRELLAADAAIHDPEVRQNVLKGACSSRSPMVLELLLEATVDLPNGKQAIMEAFDAAVKEHDEDMLRLLNEYIDPGIEVLHKVCIAGSLPLARMMLELKVPVNGEGESGIRALDLAARHLHLAVVKLLVERGADVDHGHPTFGSALSATIYGCVKRYLPDEAQPTQEAEKKSESSENYLNMWGLKPWKPDAGQISKCENIVQFLIDHGAAPEAEPREFGLTLHLACFLGNMTIIRNLLTAGADVNSEAGYFKTPLFAAIHQGHLRVVKMLLGEGGRVDYNHPQLGTPLFFASQRPNLCVALVILDYGGDPNVLGPDGSSVLSHFLVEASRGCSSPLSDGNETSLTSFLKKAKGFKLCSNHLVEAARVHSYGYSPVKDLLNYDKDITVPEEAIIASLSNHREGELRLLLERSGELGVTESMLLKARTKKDISILLQHRPRCSITDKIVEAQRGPYDQIEVMEFLLHHEPSILPTETMVIQVLKQDRHKAMYEKKTVDILDEFWARKPDLQVKKEMLEHKELEPETVKWLLSRTSKDLKITKAMLYSSRSGSQASVEATRILLKHDSAFKITEELAIDLITYGSRLDMLDAFLEHNPNMPITEPIFLTVLSAVLHWADHHEAGQKVVQILQRHNRKLCFTNKIRKLIDKTFQKHTDATMRELLYSLDESL